MLGEMLLGDHVKLRHHQKHTQKMSAKAANNTFKNVDKVATCWEVDNM